MRAVINDKYIGISNNMGWSDEKFRDVRHKAIEEHRIRNKKQKDKKGNLIEIFKPGDLVVVISQNYRGNKNRKYFMLEVIDFELTEHDNIKYFGIVLKTTDNIYRLGRMITFYKNHSYWLDKFKYENVPVDSIKWDYELDKKGEIRKVE